jgi:hypothetical protein
MQGDDEEYESDTYEEEPEAMGEGRTHGSATRVIRDGTIFPSQTLQNRNPLV